MRALLGLSTCLLAACGSHPPIAVAAPTDGGEAALPAARDFPGAADLLAGFDARGDDTWRAGDEVLFGLELRRRGAVQRWLLHLRLTEPQAFARVGDEVPPRDFLPTLEWTLGVNGVDRTFTSARCRVLATVTDADGRVLGRSEPVLPRDFLAIGFTRACELVAAARERPAEARPRRDVVAPYAQATVAAMALLQVVQDDRVLSPILWEVIEPPSWWSVVRNGGARITLRPAFDEATSVVVPAGGGGQIAWRIPLALAVNGSEALSTRLFATSAVRPQALCGGIVGATAWNPGDASREFRLVLLAARCGR